MKTQYILCFYAILTFTACSKSVGDKASSATVSEITSANAQVNSIIVSAHTSRSANITRGFCWSDSDPNPGIDSSKFLQDSGTDLEFTDTIKNLQYGTQYYIRPFVSNQTNVSYGPTDTISTLASPFTLAQIYKGGYVVFIDSSGEHGLIASGNYGHGYWETYHDIVAVGINGIGTSSELGTGAANTQAILAAGINDPAGAAGYSDNLVYENYDDWFLPSYVELLQLRQATLSSWTLAQYYPGDLYWSSSEAGASSAFVVPINAMADFSTDTKDEDHGIVAFRKF